MFSKYELVFPNQANFSSDPSQILILQHPIPIYFLLSPPTLSNFAIVNGNTNSTILIMLFFGFPIWSYPIQPHSTSIRCAKVNAKTSQSNLLSCCIKIIKLYVDEAHNHQRTESLRAVSLSKLEKMVNSNSNF